MRQCELEKVAMKKRSSYMERTGQKMVSFIDGVRPDMTGAIIDLKGLEGLWVIDKIYDQEIESHQIRRNWHVGGL